MLMMFIFIIYFITGLAIILDGFYTLYFISNKNIYTKALIEEYDKEKDSIIQKISNGWSNNDSATFNYMLLGLIMLFVSILGFIIRKPMGYKWKYELTSFYIFESFGNITVFALPFVWWFNHDSITELGFKYLIPHNLIHYASIYLIILCIFPKIYTFKLSFDDYLEYSKDKN
jgi:hypothetical protein